MNLPTKYAKRHQSVRQHKLFFIRFFRVFRGLHSSITNHPYHPLNSWFNFACGEATLGNPWSPPRGILAKD